LGPAGMKEVVGGPVRGSIVGWNLLAEEEGKVCVGHRY